jgi:hypothetical protein
MRRPIFSMDSLRRSLLTAVGAGSLVLALTVLVTWPQALYMSSRISTHFDAQFSIWRLGWIAHALATAPTRIFDANIFYPARTTLAYSDATMLQGVLGAPLFWADVSPVLIYNAMLFAGFAGSGLAVFLLTRHLTGEIDVSLVAAAIFTTLPYRTEHFFHLEMQWIVFVPLTFWALHRAIERPSVGYGIAAGVFIWLQVLSCIYYGVFLGLTLVFFAPAVVLLTGRSPYRATIVPLAVAATIAGVLTVPFALPYLAAARDIGVRPEVEITRYSATPINYLAAPELNRLWGWTAERWGSNELRLFPGLMAVLLACASALRHPRRPVVIYACLALVAILFSFGTNNPAYVLLLKYVSPLQGFRSMSRFGAFAGCAIAVLAAFGMQALLERRGLSRRWRAIATGVVLALIAFEASNRAQPLQAGIPRQAPDVYRILRSAPPGAVMELPLPPFNSYPGFDPAYQSWSLWHWKPLINGYSGYYPRDYLTTIIRMEVFPEDASINRLRAHGVRYIVVHRELYQPDRLKNLMLRFAGRPELKSWGAYEDPLGLADLFELTD